MMISMTIAAALLAASNGLDAAPRAGERAVEGLVWTAAAAPRAERQARVQQRERSEEKTTVAGSDEQGSYKVELRNGEVVKVVIDGQEVSPSRVKREGDTMKVLGDAGEERFQFKVAPGGRVIVGEGGGRGAMFATPEAEGGRPRIGVTLSEVGEAVAAQLGIDRERTTLITGVVEGGPAARAGLKPFDIVVRVNGQDRGDFEVIREVIASKQPGDEVELHILRGGEPKDVLVQVERMESRGGAGALAEAMGRREAEVRARQGGAGPGGGEALRREWTEQAQRQAEEARAMAERLREQINRQMRPIHEAMGAQIRERVMQALEEAQVDLDDEAMRSLHESLSRAFDDFGAGFPFGAMAPSMQFFGEPGQNGMLLVPPAPAPPAAAAPPAMRERRSAGQGGGEGDRLEALEDRMARMEELLRKLVERNP